MITPLILVGGSGTRLWPVSTRDRPKQFARLVGARSLFAETFERFAPARSEAPYYASAVVVGAARHRETVKRELQQLGAGACELILEPCARNTGPAICAATLCVARRDPDALVLALPSDHRVADPPAFHATVARAVPTARTGVIVTFGIVPTAPETGYGYIKRGAPAGSGFRVERFVEKPTADVARQFLESGDYDWNAGIFLFTVSEILAAFRLHAPEILDLATEAVELAQIANGATVLDPRAFAATPARSIDYAVMEHHRNMVVIPARIGWSDVGSWAALHEIAGQDRNGNVLQGRVIARDTRGSYLHADDGLIATIGVDNVAVVKSGEHVLVAALDRAQEVGHVEKALCAGGAGGPEPLPALAPAARRMRAWMLDHALPLWIEVGWDARHGGFREHLGRDGRPRPEPHRRLQVQARQIFVFAAAHLIGWPGPALERASTGFTWLIEHGWLQEGGWAHLLAPEGGIADRTRDTYDHAFVAFALAWLYRVSGEAEVLSWARRTIAYLDAVLLDPVHGGYVESVPDRLPRRANPHMHLLEAFLALFDATGDAQWLDRASEIVALFERRFFDRAKGSVGEDFTADWTAGPEAGRREPGHHFEWAWLIEQAKIRPGGAAAPDSGPLVCFAEDSGFNTHLGLVYDAVTAEGAPLGATHRLWPQTEAVRARADPAAAQTLLDRIFSHYLDPVPPGLWIDQIDGRGKPMADLVPASTLYHLMAMTLALAERAGFGPDARSWSG